jgi:hypothetical protein
MIQNTMCFMCVVIGSRLVTVGNGSVGPEISFPIWFYQRLPRPGTIPNEPMVLHVSTPTKPYHIFRRPGTNPWCFWHGLPTLTILGIWV